MLKILVVLFLLVLSLYTGLFMRAKIEDVKITDNIVDILLIPMYIMVLPIYLIILPFGVWNILKDDKFFKRKIHLLVFLLIFIYALYKLIFYMLFFKFESITRVFFTYLRYKEKTYQKNIRPKVWEGITKYIGNELTQDKLIKRYAAS